MARRRGRIARLPKEIRDQVNQKLQDGIPYKEVAQWLTEQGNGDINDQHVQVWYQGGYADWLKEQSRLEEVRVRRELAMDLLKQSDSGAFQEAAYQLAAAQLFEMLYAFDLETMKQLVQEKPEQYTRMLNALARLSRGSLNLEELKKYLEERKREGEPPRGGLSDKTLKMIEERLNLM